MSVWHCQIHGLTGPTACCGKASLAQLSHPILSHEVATLTAENTALRAEVEKWKAYRVHDVEEKDWLRDQMIALRAVLLRLQKFTFIERWASKGFDDDAQKVYDMVAAALGDKE